MLIICFQIFGNGTKYQTLAPMKVLKKSLSLSHRQLTIKSKEELTSLTFQQTFQPVGKKNIRDLNFLDFFQKSFDMNHKN